MSPVASNYRSHGDLDAYLRDAGAVGIEGIDTRRLVRRLLDGTLPAGDHAVEWDGRTDAMGAMPSGVYLYRLEAGSEAVERRMLLLH